MKYLDSKPMVFSMHTPRTETERLIDEMGERDEAVVAEARKHSIYTSCPASLLPKGEANGKT